MLEQCFLYTGGDRDGSVGLVIDPVRLELWRLVVSEVRLEETAAAACTDDQVLDVEEKTPSLVDADEY
jgi:hypothetical protein